MEQTSHIVTYMRGGASKGLFFRAEDLPSDPRDRDSFLLRAIGSPDPNGRQLDGMGSGVSSTSKAMVVFPSKRQGVDVEYDFAQFAVGEAVIDRHGNCGNLSSAIGVFAIETGMIRPPDGQVTVRMFNINTGKRVDCTLWVEDGSAAVSGDCEIAGVAGTGSPIRLDFIDPGGAGTGRLLPTGSTTDRLMLSNGDSITASIVDATNLCVFVRAADLGCSGTELPSRLRNHVRLMHQLEQIRAAASVRAGFASSIATATRDQPAVPKIAMVSEASDAPTLSGRSMRAEDCDIQVRMISMGLPHLAIPLTGALCTAVAAQIPGTLVRECARPVASGEALRVGHGSGVLPISAAVSQAGGEWRADRASVVRTARMLMKGQVFAPVTALEVAE